MNRYFLALCLLVFVATRAIAIRPDTHYVSSPDQNGLAYDSLNIVTPDHYRLTAWYCKVSEPSSKTLIVLAGGDAGNMSYDLALAQFLIENFKVPVLLFDYRGFGTSQPFSFDSNAIAEPQYLSDLDAAVSFAHASYPGNKIIVYGRSLGASLALVEAEKRRDLTGIIAESPYATQMELKKNIEAKVPGTNIAIVATDSLEPMKHIAKFGAKHLVVLHGADEKFILRDELLDLVRAVPIENKKYVEFPNCDHLEIPFKATQLFGDTVHEFLLQCR